MDLISVIMSNYNGAKYIEEAIESVLNQTIENWELIIVDDCSTDLSVEVIKKFNDKRIKLIINDKNIGPAKSRNKAIEVSNGKYIAILDSDDIAYSDRLEKQYNYMEKNNIDVLGCGALFFGKYNKKFIPKIKNKDIRAETILISPYVHSTVMLRKNVIGIRYNEEFRQAQDYKLWSDLFKNKSIKFAALESILVKYRVHDNQITKNSYSGQSKNANKIRASFFEFYNISLNDYEFELIERFFLGNCKLNNNEMSKVIDLYDLIIENEKKENTVNLKILVFRIKMQIIKNIINGSKLGNTYSKSKLRECKSNIINDLFLECFNIYERVFYGNIFKKKSLE
ncbi:glycosyltransferase family 2 protein [Clostridium perfringens]|uniref:glycosyltransferase family 2 protein n=1 Tax=Clostridium perfringens TaxID=1502 RepID=UPI00115AABE4|nr:glycosyltransferase family 2 protein [Clostridium perfringens]MBI6111898.1 glycosyltransferase family 2 protein [Clostridium perfringens]MBI6113765.1 glycosyltransferase family 2 protein [Clostridium perfringens]MDK0677302.1 glycosyltransferase family 2 protein [Clostridium perfringens]MDK0739644.1 glycosyltransferase family 2 protein [Clostridium perfringens]MDM0557438.1 glycosyltransferase family 2 protein [Clostridium perfringens]